MSDYDDPKQDGVRPVKVKIDPGAGTDFESAARTTGDRSEASLPERVIEFTVPSMLDEYRILQRLGEGGMGKVYLAHDTLLERRVAVKFINGAPSDPTVRSQTLSEARAAARIQHPNVVTVYRVGELDGRPYIITEFVGGKNLADMKLPLQPTQVLGIAVGLARGLAAAHRRGVLHLDLKPANVVLTDDGEVKLLDFGLAKFLDPVGPQDVGVLSSPSGADGESPKWRGAFVGTPYYVAREIWQGKPATRSSDVYSLGALLFELCCGRRPYQQKSLVGLASAVMNLDPPSLSQIAPDIDPRIATVVDRCLRPDPAKRFASGEELRDALERILMADRSTPPPAGNPYRGLLAFEAEHRAVFFGRTREIGTILERLRAEPFVLVTGESGTGKSSLCRAGVLPSISDGALGGRRWSLVQLVPGRRPLTALASALSGTLGTDDERMAALVREDPAALCGLIDGTRKSAGSILLFIDQLEELVTVSEPGEAALFSEALGHLFVRRPTVRLLMTVRSDFLSRVAALSGFGDELSRQIYFLRPLQPDQIREAIVEPAAAKGVAFESDEMVDSLVASTAQAEGGLPLLQFALAELWDARRGSASRITAASLAEIGGVEGALARHADQVMLGLLPAERNIARQILLALTTPDGLRVRRSESELLAEHPGARHVLDTLVRGRLLVACNVEEGTGYEVAHEALIRGWEMLRRLLEEQAEGRLVRQRIITASAEWERLERARDALFSARQLAEAALVDVAKLGDREREFLRRSRQSIGRRRLLRISVTALVLVGLALVSFIVDLKNRRALAQRVSGQLANAMSSWDNAQAQQKELDRLRKQAFKAFFEGRREQGEEEWAKVEALAQGLDRSYRDAAQWLEAVLAVDSNRDDLRRQLAEIIYTRMLADEQSHNTLLYDELVNRLELYDQKGEYVRRLRKPGTLDVRTEPSGATVTLQRYVDIAQQLVLDPPSSLGTTPLHVSLKQGSYLITLQAPDRTTIRYPLLVRRDDQLDIDLALPAPGRGPGQVPPGFIYIPAGRFIFGSADRAVDRQTFLHSIPSAEVRTEAFLIAIHETTYAEWIAYLRSLPRNHPSRHLGAGSGDLSGRVQLTDLPDGRWQLNLDLGSQHYVAHTGELMDLHRPSGVVAVDWTRLPVTGISRDEARDYLRWLSQTGRVLGARLCSDFEWERAARGADDRTYPQGFRIRANDANFDETHRKDPENAGPDLVGVYEKDASPFGVRDLVGNVFEWIQSSFDPAEPFARGGAFSHDAATSRSNNRTPLTNDFRDPRLGLRVCASFPRL